jgi:hypothetical protein
MKDLLGLHSILVILAVSALALLLIAGVVVLDKAKYIIPSPEMTATQMVDALGAHRYQGAMNQLSQELKEQVSEQDLKSVVRSIENSQSGIYQADEGAAQVQGQMARAQVKVRLGNGQENIIEFPLQKENGLWKVSSLEPLHSLMESDDF